MSDEKKTWLDHPRAAYWIFWTLASVCVALVLGWLIYERSQPSKVHVHYEWERWIGFYGIYGFVGCVILVLLAKEMRKLVKRDEDYYDR